VVCAGAVVRPQSSLRRIVRDATIWGCTQIKMAKERERLNAATLDSNLNSVAAHSVPVDALQVRAA
jgi:hypothetical protein